MKDVKTIFDSFKRYLINYYGDKYLNKRGKLDRNHIVWVLRHRKQNSQELSEILSAVNDDPDLKKNYIYKLSNGMTFVDIENLITLFNYHNYTNNSLTDYSQWVGLMSQGDHRYLRDDANIVLGFPYKDATLKGGMDKGEKGVSEPFYNNIIDRPEITELLEPKVMMDVKRYDKNHLNGASTNNFNPNKDSLFIKGNNLLALYSLLPKYAGKVKMIYIDPPYNTGHDDFQYNDRFNQSTWLVFMKNRLKVAKKMLRRNGVILISCDDNEQAYLKVLADEMFGKENFIANLIVRIGGGIHQDQLGFADNKNYVLVYTRDINEAKKGNTFYGIHRSLKEMKGWKKDKIGWYKLKGMKMSGTNAPRSKRPHLYFPICINSNKKISLPNTDKNGKVVQNIPSDSHLIYPNSNGKQLTWRWSKDKMQKQPNDIAVKYINGQYKVYRKQRNVYKKPDVLFMDSKYFSKTGQNEITKLFSKRIFNYPKPEELLHDLIQICSTTHKNKSNDIVMDFFAGSATTQAVAMKMKRRFIGIEQMNYVDTISVPRLQEVIKGEQGGISKLVQWQGGGSFVYAKLMPLNVKYFDELRINRRHSDKLDDVAKDIFDNAEINATAEVLHAQKLYKRNASKWDAGKKFKYLWSVLDENQMYVNYHNIDSQAVKDSRLLDKTSYEFNHNFYGKLS